MTTPRTPGLRERNRAALEREIVRVGRLQLAEVGAAALSLRAVARDLGMVSSAVYRYVSSRDDLLTLLIVAAYDDLGDAVDAALDALPDDTAARTRFTVLCHSVRSWALDHPHDYALVYGSPVPHYAAPPERTNAAGTRVQAHLVALLGDAGDAVVPAGAPDVVAAGARALAPLVEQDPLFTASRTRPAALLRGLAAWHLVLGALSAEIFEQLGPDTIADPDAHFAAMVALAADLVLPAT